MALYRECCFPNCTKSWWIKLLSQVLGGRSPQSPPSGIRPWLRCRGNTYDQEKTHRALATQCPKVGKSSLWFPLTFGKIVIDGIHISRDWLVLPSFSIYWNHSDRKKQLRINSSCITGRSVFSARKCHNAFANFLLSRSDLEVLFLFWAL